MSEHLFSIFPAENFIDLSLFQFGWEKCEKLHSYGPAVRNHYLFHYIISGKGKLIANDSRQVEQHYYLSANQGFIIYPGQVNTYYADAEDPWEYVWLEFDGLRVSEFLQLANLTPDSPVYRPFSRDLGEKVKNEMLYIVQHSHHDSLELIGHLYLFMSNLTYSVTSFYDRRQSNLSLKDYYINEVITYVEQHYHETITVEHLANLCNLNRSYFTKIFKQATKSSPQDFIIKYRMTKAAEFLKLTDNSIKKISELVGYPNQLYFSKAFKIYYGISPREYRKKFQLLLTPSTTDKSI